MLGARVLRLQVLRTLAVLVLAVPLVRAQGAGGVIDGRVVDGVTGRPVSMAIVAIGGPALVGQAPADQPARVITDAAGRFVFRGLPAGSYAISASKGGYADGEPGRRRPGGDAPAIVLSDTVMTKDLVVPMWKYSAISGTVIDEAGEPVVAVQVRALTHPAGRRKYTIAQTTFTDDRGEYRFGTLVPGEYLIVAARPPLSANADVFARGTHFISTTTFSEFETPLGGSPGVRVGRALLASGRGAAIPPSPLGDHLAIYPPTFFPASATPAQASPIRLGLGEERAGIDVQLAPVPAARVSGVLLGEGEPETMATIRLVPEGGEPLPADVAGATSITDSRGEFTFAGVMPGRYTLRASTAGTGSTRWAALPLTIGGDDVDGLTVTLNAPLSITTRARYEGSTARPAEPAMRFTLFVAEQVDGPFESKGLSSVWKEGVFTMSGFVPARYRLTSNEAPPGWIFKAALLDGVDVSETPFELRRNVDVTLVFTDREARIDGRVDGDAASVLLFPADASRWADASPASPRYRRVKPEATGEFTIRALLSGEYYVAAVRDDDISDWRDPATLESLARLATLVSLNEGEVTRVTLPAKGMR